MENPEDILRTLQSVLPTQLLAPSMLSLLTPAEPVMVCRQLSDSRLFAFWPEIRQSIPLDLMECRDDRGHTSRASLPEMCPDSDS